MKILADDRKAAAEFKVSAYGVAQARELQELALSNHPLASEAGELAEKVLQGTVELGSAYKIVERAKPVSTRSLLQAEIDSEVLNSLKALAKERKQLFRDMVEEMAMVYYVLVANPDIQETLPEG